MPPSPWKSQRHVRRRNAESPCSECVALFLPPGFLPLLKCDAPDEKRRSKIPAQFLSSKRCALPLRLNGKCAAIPHDAAFAIRAILCAKFPAIQFLSVALLI